MKASGLGLWALALAALVSSCSSDDRDNESSAGDGAGGAAMGGSAGSGGGGSPAAGGEAASGGVAGVVAIGGTAGSMSGGAGGIDACVGETTTAEQVQVDLFMMVDTSGSMLALAGDGTSDKWSLVKSAVAAFLNEPGSAGLGVGIQYFPLTKPGVPASCTENSQCGDSGPCFLRLCWGALDFATVVCDVDADCVGDGDFGPCVSFGFCSADDSYLCSQIGTPCTDGVVNLGICEAPESTCIEGYECAVAPYSMPAVEIATLPGAAAALVESMDAQQPNGQTPTRPALEGALTHARSHALANPDRTVVAVLATDGLPTECDPIDIASVATQAALGFEATPSVRTFVIGVFAPEDTGAHQNLDTIAQAGGTDAAFIVETSGDVSAQFLAALSQIRGDTLSCEFQIPTPDPGQTLDFALVNVVFSEAGSSRRLFQVPERAACGPDGGWYYDNPSAPTRIVVCPADCDLFQSSSAGSVEIELGCQTVVR